MLEPHSRENGVYLSVVIGMEHSKAPIIVESDPSQSEGSVVNVRSSDVLISIK
jgi:hypothetical protein